MQDWLGSTIEEGDLVLYTSKSINTGMVLAEVLRIDNKSIKVKVLDSADGQTAKRTILLHEGQSAYRAITKFKVSDF